MSRLSKIKNKIKTFDYGDLRFLYIVCLLSIAAVFTLFRWTQSQMAKDETAVVRLLEHIALQRENLTRYQNVVTAAAPPSEIEGLYRKLEEGHRSLLLELGLVARYCSGRPCARLFSEDLARTKNSARDYQIAIWDASDMGLSLIEQNSKARGVHSLVLYITILVLLWMQALYVFRPALRKINQALTIRSDFLSRISHEVRNPMNSILGMADILKGTRLNFEQQQYVESLFKAGHDLLDMLNDLIDFSSIEKGRLQLQSKPFDLFQAVERCTHLLAFQTHHKNLALYTIVDGNLPNHLVGDHLRFEQVLINLLGNAVKFTEQGEVRLILREVPAKHNGHNPTLMLECAIEDSGPGIAPELLHDIFEGFVQADSSIQRRYGGAGLGLTISREIVKLMGGEIRVQSTLGQGSRFEFTVPFELVDPEPAEEERPLRSLAKKEFVLLADESLKPSLARVFEPLNCVLDFYSSQEFWVSSLAEKPVTEVHAVLIDDSIGIISMIEAHKSAERLGLSEYTAALIRSDCTREHLELLKRNGFKKFLTKPLAPWKLALSLNSGPAEIAPAEIINNEASLAAQLQSRNLKLLVVDDSDDNLFLLKELLNPISKEIDFASNGLEAVRLFESKRYDAVFMDIQMPVMDGYTAIRKMRQYENEFSTGEAKIFAVTAHSGLVDAKKCLEAGFNARIVKPLQRQEIFHVLQSSC